MTEEYLTVKEVSEYMKCSVKSVYNMIHESGMPHLSIGKIIRIPKNELIEYLQSKTVVKTAIFDTPELSRSRQENRKVGRAWER